MAKAFLGEHKMEYTEKNVATDMAAREEMVKKSGQLGVPVIDIDGQILVGFDQERMEDILKIK
jgi:glutaredoxin